jgi:hypothetical protein
MTAKVGATPLAPLRCHEKDIIAEYMMDEKLVKNGWQMEWVFIDCAPSAPLKKALLDRGIKVTLK